MCPLFNCFVLKQQISQISHYLQNQLMSSRGANATAILARGALFVLRRCVDRRPSAYINNCPNYLCTWASPISLLPRLNIPRRTQRQEQKTQSRAPSLLAWGTTRVQPTWLYYISLFEYIRGHSILIKYERSKPVRLVDDRPDGPLW